MIDFTPEEKQFLVNILASLSIKPADKEAQKTVSLVQGLLGKLVDANKE